MIYILSPHLDDALISAGGHIERWIADGQQVEILYVFTSKPIAEEEARAYAGAVKAGCQVMGFVSPGRDESGEIKPFLHCASGIELHLWRVWRSKVYALVESGHRVIAPLGFGHPEHELVRSQFAHTECYVDMPYGINKGGSIRAEEAMKGKVITGYMFPNWGKKWEQAKVFPSQHSVIWWEWRRDWDKCFEILLKESA